MEEYESRSDETDEINILDESESEICNSSCCSDSDCELPWLENVKSDGSLFYIEQNADLDPFLEDSVSQSQQIELGSHMKRSKSKLNPAEKIKRWVKNRRKKVRKSFPLLKSTGSDPNFNPFPSLDTVTDFQSKEIFFDVNPSNIPASCNLPLSEILLGLKLGPLEEVNGLYDKPSILCINPCENVPDVKIGDWIKSVNNIDVNMSNIENVLKEIPVPSKVKLTILSQQNPLNVKPHSIPSKHNNLLKELLGDSSAMQQAKLQCQHIQHGLFYLSIENGTFENDDVIYRYPNSDTALFKLKGMFLTLGHMISDVASTPLLSCSVMIQGEIIHVGFAKEENDIMILALPASVASVPEVQHFTAGLTKLLKYQFGSLQKAFKEPEEENYLDKFLTLYFKHYLSSSLNYSQNILSEPHLLDILPSAHWLPIPNDLKTEIDDIMSELESSDFGIDSDGFDGNRRIFNISGSCLFYKGYLLCSHLPKDDLLDIHLFLHYNHILELTRIQPVSQIIIWKQVFPSRNRECAPNPDTQYMESHGDRFLLIVVMQYSVLAVLLDDGGEYVWEEEYPAPEPFYVEEVQNTLFILQDCGITAAVEKLLHFRLFPVVSSDVFPKENSSHNSLSSAFPSNVSIHSAGPNMSSDHSTGHSNLMTEKEGALKMFRCSSNEKIDEAKRQLLLSSIGPADGESDTESSFSNDSNDMDSFEKRFRSCSVSTGSRPKSQASSECSQVDKDELTQHSSSSLPNLSGTAYPDDICFENSFRMVTGFGNDLFYYLHMDPVEGIFIAPVMPDSFSVGSVQDSILENFQRSSLNMRTVFERSLRNGEIAKANIKTKYGVNTFLQNAYEQGVLFQHNQIDSVKQKGSHHPEYFWVVGRLFFAPEPREIYVCYSDITPQDTVEMAFRLGFGLSF